jgi:para-aminobenzoate synthetase/4-amino-4-deoxychorismate lyase
MIAIDFPNIQLFSRQPEYIVTTDRHDQVVATLEKVETLCKKGYYAVGFVSYEASPAFDLHLSVSVQHQLPLVWFALFQKNEQYNDNGTGKYHLSEWVPNHSEETYRQAIATIRQAIARGETYQVNYTIRLEAEFHGDAWAYYQYLRNLQLGYRAYLDLGQYQLLSLSPELFFQRIGDQIITRPMKGTIKRGRTQQEDMFQAEQLFKSQKDRAENAMIVDLLRNDLSKIATLGSVTVPSLFSLEKYPTVWQMTSTVAGSLPPQTTLADIFTALFPCGSITGAPKQKTMEIIHQLEDTPREAYCGAIGYIAPNGDAVFNVAIRTVIIDSFQNCATYGAGSGVTWDSTSDAEYNEVIAKAKVLTDKPYQHQLLESIRLEDGNYTWLDQHLQRMEASADYFSFAFSKKRILAQLEQLAKQYPTGIYKVRLLLANTGEITVEAAELVDWNEPISVTLADKPISSSNVFLYHKTTERSMYESHRNQEYIDTLLWNEREELTEFTTGNVVLEIDGKRLTPPQQVGLLAGTMREQLLATGEIEECVLYRSDVKRAIAVWLINSVRGWVTCEMN